MRIHYLQHVPFEDLGSLEPALLAMGHSVACTRLHSDHSLPGVEDFDALIVMGGPMGVHDEDIYPWLVDEKSLIRNVIDKSRKPLLGICLGAQLIADVLGAPVTRNPYTEIGWFPLHLDPAFMASPWAATLVNGDPVFHWHGDTFALPQGALPVGSSAACEAQGYIIDDRIVGLQFHLETTLESAASLIRECGNELAVGAFVQSAETIMAEPERFTRINAAAAALAHHWLKGPLSP